MLHTSRPDNTSGALLQLHTAPNCQYKVLRSGYQEEAHCPLHICSDKLFNVYL